MAGELNYIELNYIEVKQSFNRYDCEFFTIYFLTEQYLIISDNEGKDFFAKVGLLNCIYFVSPFENGPKFYFSSKYQHNLADYTLERKSRQKI